MPLYNFYCAGCDAPKRKILRPTEIKGQLCSECGGPLVRAPEPPSTQVIERIDNGIMPRAVERLRDAERLYKERSQNAGKFEPK